MKRWLGRWGSTVPAQPTRQTAPRQLRLERLEPKVLWNAAVPELALIGLPAEPFINANFSFSVEFENDSANNAATDPGFAPFIELLVPEGVDLANASFLGQSLGITTVGFFDATEQRFEEVAGGAGNEVTEHPLGGAIALPSGPTFGGVTLTDNMQLVAVQLPFGSFVFDQPGATIDFNASTDGVSGGGVALPNTPLDIVTRGGFAFGDDQLDNPDTDPPILSAPQASSVTPQVMELSKRQSASEDEVATGPNFPVTYTISLRVADQEVLGVDDSGAGGGLNDVTITDTLPDDFVLDTSFGGGDGVLVTGPAPGDILSESVAAGVVTVVVDSVTGSGGNDVVVQVRGYYDDATVADAPGEDETQRINEAEVVTGHDPDGPGALGFGQIDDSDSVAIDVGILNIRKSVDDASTTPGDTNTWTLSFNVSDFDSFSALTITDTFSDGLEFDSSFAPTLNVNQDGAATAGTFDLATEVAVAVDGGTGATTLDLDLSSALVRLGHATGGTLRGDLIDSTAHGPTSGTITFRTNVLSEFRATFPSGDASVDIGDRFINDVQIEGTSAGGNLQSDESQDALTVRTLNVDKSIFAVDGNTGFTDVVIAPGEDITYRLTVTLESPDVENLKISDFLPLPVFLAGSVSSAPGDFNTTASAALPASGTASFGPAHNLHTFTFNGAGPNSPPTVTTDATSNTVTFDFGSFDSEDTGQAVIDILFTVTATDRPFGDGLNLTNQMQTSFGTSGNEAVSNVDIVQVELVQPNMTLTKGVVSSDRVAADETFDPDPATPVAFIEPGIDPSTNGPFGAAFSAPITSALLDATPIDSDLTGVDAGDLVKFALVLENEGQRAALGALVRDTLPAGFEIPSVPTGLNLNVFDGQGNALAITDASGDAIATADLPQFLFSNVAGSSADGDANGGLRVATLARGVNPSNDQPNPDGDNVLVITYDLQVDDEADDGFADINPSAAIENTAELLEFFATAGPSARDFTDDDDGNQLAGYADSATVTLFGPTIVKALAGSDEASTAGSDFAIGETATYELTVTVPEGTVTGLVVRDSIPAGMQFVSGSLALDTSGFDGDLVAGDITVGGGGGNGTDVTFTFAEFEAHASAAGSSQNTFDLRFEAVVLDTAANVAGRSVDNSANIDWTGNPAAAVQSNVVGGELVVPDLSLTKTIAPDSGDAGDTVTVTIEVENSGDADAFAVAVTDPLDLVTLDGATVSSFAVSAGGFVGAFASPNVTFTGGTVAAGSTVSLSFTARLSSDAVAASVSTNTATITSADTHSGSPAEQRDLAGPSGSDDLTVSSPTVTKVLTSTEITAADNGASEAVVGELVTYTITLEIPEGRTEAAVLTDTLDAGLGFVRVVSVTPSANVSFSGTPGTPNVDGTGRVVSYDFGTITNTDSEDATAGPESPDTITVVFEAMVTNVASNVIGQTLNNDAVMSFTGGSISDQADTDVTVVQPVVSVDKKVEVDVSGTFVENASADAGDTVRYTIVVGHDSGPAAFDSTFSDVVPSDIAISSATVTASWLVAPNDDLIATGVFEVVGNTVRTVAGQSFDLTSGENVTIVIEGTFKTAVTPSQVITNEATAEYTTMDGDIIDRSADVPDAENDERSLSVTDDTTTTINPVVPVKSIVATSQAHTGNVGGVEHLAIGEIVRYRLSTELPEGTSANILIRDNLPSGLQYVDGSARLAFVSTLGTTLSTDDGGIDTTLGGAGVAGTTDAGVTPSFVLPDANVSTSRTADDDNYGDGTDVFFRLGTVTNADSDPDPEFVIIEFNAVVLNVADNQAVSNADATDLDTELDNTHSVEVDSNAIGTSPAVDAQIVEPVILFDSKLVTTSPMDAGDTVVYELKLTNQDTADGDAATAFDISIRDQLDARLDLQNSGDVGVTVTGSAGSTVTNLSNPATDLVEISIDELAVGGQVTVTVTAEVVPNAEALRNIDNAATVTYSSLPGSGTMGNPTGTDLTSLTGASERGGEHDGSGAPLNDYNDSISGPRVTLAAPSIDAQIDPTTYTIGDRPTIDIVVTLPEGVTPDLLIEERLPAGLDYTGFSIITSAAASGGLLTSDYQGAGSLPAPSATDPSGVSSGGDATFDFGDTTNPEDGDSTNDSFILRVDTLVLNELGNQNTDVLATDANLQFSDANDSSTVTVQDATDPSVTLIEPELGVTKTVTDGGGGELDAGDNVTFEIVVAHLGSSGADAFEVLLGDTVPALLENVTLDSAVVTDGATTTDVSGSLSLVANSLTTTGDIDLVRNTNGANHEQLVVTLSGQVVDSANPSDVISNTADATWTSLDGTNANERGAGNGLLGAGGLDDYAAEGDVAVTVAGTFQVEKTADVTTATIGDVVKYTLTVELGEGTTENVVINDTLPAGVVYLNDAAIVTAGAVSSFGSGLQANLAGGVLGMTIDEVVVPSDGAGDDDTVAESTQFTIEYSVRLDNVGAVQNGVALINDADASASGVSPDNDNRVTVTVTEPDLEVSKTIRGGVGDGANLDAGDFVSYEIVVSHSAGSTADAFDVNLGDAFPSFLDNLTLLGAEVSDGATTTDVSGAINLAGNSLSTTGNIDLGRMTNGANHETLTVAVRGEVIDAVTAGDTIDNTASVSYTSRDGADANERGGGGGVNDYESSGDAPQLTVSGVFDVAKAANVATAVVGDVIQYTLTVEVSEGTTENISIADTLPGGVVYLNDATVATAGTVSSFGSGLQVYFSGGVLQLDLDEVVVPGTGTSDDTQGTTQFTITYSVRVDDTGAVANGVNLLNDADTSADGHTDDNDNQVTVGVEEPLLTVSKTADDTTPHFGQTVTYTIVVEHDLPTSSAPAFDLTLDDLLNDPAFALVPGSVVPVLSGGGGVVTVVSGNAGADTSVSVTASQLDEGETLTLTFDAVVTSDPAAHPLGSDIDNSVSLGYDTRAGNDPNERVFSDQASEELIVVGADLAVTKDDGAVSQLTPGGSTTYTIVVRNNGTDAATNVVVTDTLAPGLRFDSASAGGTETTPGVVEWTFASIAPAGSESVTVTVNVDNPAPAGVQSYLNSVSVVHDDIEPTPQDNSATDDNALDGAPNLNIVKTIVGVPPHEFDAGETVDYRITVTNTGNQGASGVTVLDTFPSHALDFVSATDNPGAGPGDAALLGFDGNFITWDLDVLEVGETVLLDVQATVKAPLPLLITDFTNRVDISDDGTSNPDPDPSDNGSIATADLPARPDLTVSKTNDADSVRPGDPVSWTIVVRNAGGQNSSNVVVTDTFDPSLLENVSAPGGTVDSARGTITFNIPLLAGLGGRETFVVSADVVQPTPAGVSSLTNSVTVADDGTNGADINPSNNSTEDVDEIEVFVADALNNFAPANAFGQFNDAGLFASEDPDEFLRPITRADFTTAPLPVAPIYSGWAEPGSVLTVTLFNELGVPIGQQAVMVDTGGNWVTTFPNVIVKDHPYAVEVGQSSSGHNGSTPSGFNFRTYFSPALHGHVFWTRDITPTTVFGNAPEAVMDALSQQNTRPLPIGWNEFFGYEFLGASTTPSQYAG